MTRRSEGPSALLLAACVACAAQVSVTADEPGPPVQTPGNRAKLARVEDFAPAEEFVNVGAVKTHFVRKGENGPAVVLVHGFGASTYGWRKNLDALAAGHRVFALDMKGFGLTAKPRDGEYHPRAYAEHLLGFLDAMRIDRAVLVGHSLGGAVVTRLALRHPERVLGLVLVAPALPSAEPADTPPKPPATKKKAPADGPEPLKNVSVGPIPALAVRALPAVLRATITRQTIRSGLESAFHNPGLVTAEMIEVYYRPITIEGGAEALAAMMNPPPTAADGPLPPLGSLKVPTLVATGAHDRLVPPSVTGRYVKAIPGAESADFQNSGHVPQEEEPDRFNARVLEFLRLQRLSGTGDPSKRRGSLPEVDHGRMTHVGLASACPLGRIGGRKPALRGSGVCNPEVLRRKPTLPSEPAI